MNTQTPVDQVQPPRPSKEGEGEIVEQNALLRPGETPQDVELSEALKHLPPAQLTKGKRPDLKAYVFDTAESFEVGQRMAKALASTSLIPKEYQNNMPNCLIALEIAQRSNAPILSVMQNLNIIQGRPCWSSQFTIAAINNCGRFKPLQFALKKAKKRTRLKYTLSIVEWENRQRKVHKVDKAVTITNITCVGYTYDKDGKKITGPEASLEMAYKEGWFDKDGSKWQTMPELMLRYRAAAFFGRLYAPDVLMGMQTSEEITDVGYNDEPESKLRKAKPTKVSDLNEELEGEVVEHE